MNRRKLLTVVGAGAIGVAGIPGKGIAQSDNFSIQLEGPVTHQSSGTGEPITTRHSLEVSIDKKITLGGDSNRFVQVRNDDTGSDVLIIPDQRFTGVEKVSLQNVVGNDRRLKPDKNNLVLTVDGEFTTDVAFSIEGDADTYESGGVFSSLSVAIVEGRSNPTVLAETKSRIRGVGWQRSQLKQEGTTGSATITFDAIDPPLDEDWYVEFKIDDDSGSTILGPTELDNNGENITGTIDISGLSPGEYNGWDFDVYPSGEQTDSSYSIIGGYGTFGKAVVVESEEKGDKPEVALSGSTITIDTGGSAAVGVDDLPDDVSVSEISDGGGQPPSNQDGIVWQSAAGLPSTVSFTLTPGSSYAAGDTITFTAAGTERTLTVVESSTPAEIADTVSNKQYNAWAGSDSKIDQQEAINGFNGWFNKGSHNGESLNQQEALDLFNYWFNNG